MMLRKFSRFEYDQMCCCRMQNSRAVEITIESSIESSKEKSGSWNIISKSLLEERC